MRNDSEDDPALAPFLTFLAGDTRSRPEALRPVSPDLAARIRRLVGDDEFDADEHIQGDVAL